MNRYRVVISPGPMESMFECEAEDKEHAKLLAREVHPSAALGMVFRLDLPGVPKKRSRNSRYRMVDVDKMPDVRVGARQPRRRRHGRARR